MKHRIVSALFASMRELGRKGKISLMLVFSAASLGLLYLALLKGSPSSVASASPVMLAAQLGGPPIMTESQAPECDAANDGPYAPNGPTNTCAGARPPGSDYNTNIGDGSGEGPFTGTPTGPSGPSTGDPGRRGPESGMTWNTPKAIPKMRMSVHPEMTAVVPPDPTSGGAGSAPPLRDNPLTNEPLGGDPTGEGAGFLIERFLAQGCTPVSTLRLQWGENDMVEAGVLVGRRYFSGVAPGIASGNVGFGWFHSFYEQLGQLPSPIPLPSGQTSTSASSSQPAQPSASDRLVHMTWDNPYASARQAYTWSASSGTWIAPAFIGSVIAPLDPQASQPEWPGACYRLSFKDGRKHYFDVNGKVLSRVPRVGPAELRFAYDVSGHLSSVTDARGRVFLVGSDAQGRITSVTDPAGKSVTYTIDNQTNTLSSVTFPARSVLSNGIDAQGHAVRAAWGSAANRATTRSYQYSTVSSKLITATNDAGQNELVVQYQVDNPVGQSLPYADQKVWKLTNATGGTWAFSENSSTLRTVIDPRGFKREYVLDASAFPIEMRQYVTSTDPTVQSRLGGGYRSWQFVRDSGCQCGLVKTFVEPDGCAWNIYYTASYCVDHIERTPNDGSTDRITWSWTYDSQGRIASYVPPEANAQANPALYTYTYVYTNLTAGDPVAPNGFQLSISTPAGNIRPSPTIWTYRYDSSMRLVEFQGPSNDGVNPGAYARYEYYPTTSDGNSGLLKREYIRQDLSIWSQYGYDAAGRLSSTTTSAGYVFTSVWDDDGNQIQLICPNRGSQQYQEEWQHDGQGRTSKVRYRYYDKGPSPTGTDPFVWVENNFWYDADGRRRFSDHDADAGVVALEETRYDLSGNPCYFADADGTQTTALYDERNLRWQVREAYGTPQESLTTIDYTPNGDVTRHTSPLDSTRTTTSNFGYDKFDRLAYVEVAGQNRVSLLQDAAGRITQLDSYGRSNGSLVLTHRQTAQYLDWHGGPTSGTKQIYNDAGTTLLRTISSSIDHGPSGQPLVVRVGAEVYARFQYKAWGAPQRVYDDNGNAEEILYESTAGHVSGHIVTQVDPVHGTTIVIQRNYGLDPSGRVTGVTYTGTGQPQRVEAYQYDSLDNVVRYTDPANVITKGVYRYDGHLKTLYKDYNPSTGQASSTEQYTYSAGGLVQTATDNRGKSVTWIYDFMHRLQKEVEPDASFWQWTYNVGGYLQNVSTPTGRVMTYSYDTRGLPTSRIITQGATTLRTDNYVWNMSGGLSQVQKVEGSLTSTVAFTRDTEGNALTETADGKLVTYTRDSLGRVTRLAGPNSTRNYTYDHYNRVSRVLDAAQSEIASLYYVGPGGALARRTLRDGTQEDVIRDGYGRVDQLLTVRAGATLFNYDYQWALDGTLQFENRIHDGRGDVYRYDGLKRLQQFVRNSINPGAELTTPGSVANDSLVTYHLDGDDHRTAVDTKPWQGSTTTIPYTTFANRGHYSSVNGLARTMSLDGDLLTAGTRRFTYDAVDQLITVKDGTATTATYTYDALDRRSTKTVGTTKTTFVNAGPWVIEELTSVSGGATTVEAINYQAVGVDDVILTQRVDRNDLNGNGNKSERLDFYLHRNQLGSVMDITLANGTVVEKIRYDAYGKPSFYNQAGSLIAASKTGNRFLFTGREFDAETGYYHYRARTYDPAVGAFLQEDPLGLAPGLNPVGYVAANPVTSCDPMGAASLADTVDAIVQFLKNNAQLVTDMALDIFAPLGGLIDAIAAATGYDIRGMIAHGFQEILELGWYDRAMAAVSAVAAVGGVIAILSKLDDILAGLKKLVNAAKESQLGKKVAQAGKAVEKLEHECPSGCFAAGTLVMLASGDFTPIEAMQLGDMVACRECRSEGGNGREARGEMEAELGPGILDGDWLCGELVLLRNPSDIVRIELLRTHCWWTDHALNGGTALEVNLPELGVVGIGTVVRTWRPTFVVDLGSACSRPITGRFISTGGKTVSLHLAGESDEILSTPSHRFWSDTRHTWVPAVGLLPGELLSGLCGVDSSTTRVMVSGAHPVLGTSIVYNLEVALAHDYRVSPLGILVHNGCNKLKPHPEATGDHCTWRTDPDGSVSHTAEWHSNPKNPSHFDEGKVFDATGEAHYNKKTGQDVPTPHVHDPHTPGGVRPPAPGETPGGGK